MRGNALVNKYSKKSLAELEYEFNGFRGLASMDFEVVESKRHFHILKRLKRAFINPYSVVLFVLAGISLLIDIIVPKEKSYTSFIIISLMLIVSGIVRFIEELKAIRAMDRLNSISATMCYAKRDNEFVAIASNRLVPNDIVRLKSGDKVPADLRIIKSKSLYVSMASITGEGDLIEKNEYEEEELKNILFMGSTIASGECEGICLAFKNDTVYGDLNIKKDRKEGFDKGANSIILVLIKFMIILIPLVFISSGILKGDWFNAFLFSISVAVGLTPELLPMVITACLARGSSRMKDKNTVVKNINAMQALGSMDTLCLDKTGTLTSDRLILEYYMDIIGNESKMVLDLAYLNSYFSTGCENQLDKAVLELIQNDYIKLHLKDLVRSYSLLKEIPFGYLDKISAVALKSFNEIKLIAKGSIDDILKRCGYIDYKGRVSKISASDKESAYLVADDILEDGMKVIAIAYKKLDSSNINASALEDLVLIGFIAFFDSPKEDAIGAIEGLNNLNLELKLLTGDKRLVSESICKRLNMKINGSITGAELDLMNEDDKLMAIEANTIFSELSPKNKEEIVEILKGNGHIVGFMGDGMNDIRAINKADVGISVDNSVKALKDASDVILLRKDLRVLEEGIIEGRRAFYNMSKYIKITASSNLGNIIAIIIGSLLLPFLPITSIELLLLNLLYDIMCLAMPWDNVNIDYLKKPLSWSGGTLSRFMLYFGPISSIFDIICFAFLFFYIGPLATGGPFNSLSSDKQLLFISLFQTGWFLESMWSQVLIIQMLRSKGLPKGKDRPSRVLLLVTVLGVIVLTIFAVTPAGGYIGFTPLPASYYLFLFIVVIAYMLVVSSFKYLYIKKYKDLI